MGRDGSEHASLDVPGVSTGVYTSFPDGHGNLAKEDPRRSSQHSLVPSEADTEEGRRRTLLVVYIHGFMGNDTSFQSFPAHVHHYLKIHLAESHVVHSKIYPKYKTYKAIDVARDNFSEWLKPHETSTTDVVLVGHSMGGLLSAEVVLTGNRRQNSVDIFEHRILGTVNLDAPLLGLHPGIITSGIASLFRSKPEQPKTFAELAHQDAAGQAIGSSAASHESSIYSGSDLALHSPVSPLQSPILGSAMTLDPNFDPAFPNDVRRKERRWWQNVAHFAKKHSSEGIMRASSQHIMSHLEFGGCLADYSRLRQRYDNLRKLEDADDFQNHNFPHMPPRVRFVQYYTVCYGWPKKPKTPKVDPTLSTSEGGGLDTLKPSAPGSKASSRASTPRISIEDHSDGGRPTMQKELHTFSDNHKDEALAEATLSDSIPDDVSESSLAMLAPDPMSDENSEAGSSRPTTSSAKESATKRPASSDELPPSYNAVQATDSLQTSQAARDAIDADDSKKKGDTSISTANHVEDHPQGSEADESKDTAREISQALEAFKLGLPDLPDLPSRPEEPNLDKINDVDIRKQVEKEAKRRQKAYEKAIKNYEKALNERKKVVEKRRKKLESEAEKQTREKEKQLRAAEADLEQKKAQEVGTSQPEIRENEPTSYHATSTAITSSTSASTRDPTRESSALSQLQPTSTNDSTTESGTKGKGIETQGSVDTDKTGKQQKPRKEKKFCWVPSNDSKWVKVSMNDVDEPTAHCGLFFPGPHYETLVSDVGDLVVQWVQDDATKRVVLGMG